MLRALLVDDEIASIRSLEILLSQFCKQVEVVGTARSVEDALSQVTKLKPDLVFLDIEMPTGTGFDFLERSSACNFEIIFITAHNNYAVKAFKYSAIDYILKPIEIDELVKAVEKVIEMKKTNFDSRNKYNALFDNIKEIIPQKLVVIVNDQYDYIDLREVLYFELIDSKISVHLDGGKTIKINDTFSSIEESLLDRDFYRIHQNYLVNTQKVKKISKTNSINLELINGLQLPLNPMKKDEFIVKLSEMNNCNI
jgi:two-component system, LytTR family, response regulator